MIKLTQTQTQKRVQRLSSTLCLSISEQEKLKQRWNKWLEEPFAFIPSDVKNRITPEEAEAANVRLGEFATNYLIQRIEQVDDEEMRRRMWEKYKIVAIGFGRRYDSHWLKEALLAGYETWWLDVSTVACREAEREMARQYSKLPQEVGVYPAIEVKNCEIRTALCDPGNIGLDLYKVKIWYLCRTLGCLSIRSAKIVLQAMGTSLSEKDDPEKKSSIVIVNALRDYNPGYIGERSNLHSMRMILTNASRGAGRPVEACHEASYRYFGKIVTAMTLRAK